MAEIYTLCPECIHITNTHNETGCRAYGCGCKKEY